MEQDVENKKNIYRIVKCPLKSVLKHYDKIQPIIENAVIDINDITILGYQFIKLYFINKFNKNEELPKLNKQFVLDVLKTVSSSKTNRGKQKKKIKNENTKSEIKLFHKNIFSRLTDAKLSYTNKSHILEQQALQMITCINTNISTHFLEYLFRYINCIFKKPVIDEIKKEKDKNKRKELYKALNKEIRDLKTDLFNNKIKNSDKKYHKWIKDNKKLLFPIKIDKNISYDVKKHPDKYIKYSLYINSKIEELKYKPYQVFPQRNNIVPKHIVLNSSGFVQMLDDKKKEIFNYKKSDMILHCKKYQKHIWKETLKLEKRSIFNQNEYVFYNQILTDGFSCSLLFILEEYKDKKFGQILPKNNTEKGFTKVIDLTKEECNEYLTDKYILTGLDPGLNKIVSIIDDKNNFYKYTCCRRRNDTFTKRVNQITLAEKNSNNIIEKETELSKFSSRTLKENDFKKFINKKNDINKNIKNFYNRKLFRKNKFRIYSNTKKSEDALLNEVENKFLTKEDKEKNKKLVLLYGNWSRSSQMKNFMPTSGLGIKRLLNKRFIILDVDEYKTSKIHNRTLKELTNIKIRKNNHSKKIHEVLTLKEETERCIFVNRDKNACKNILLIGKRFLKNQTRPDIFKRKQVNQTVIQGR